jgi:hypothetical protein
MKLDDILNTPKVQPEVVDTQKAVDDEVEKLAEYLDAFAEEDTLLDDLAKAAVVADMLEKRYGH